MGKWIKKWGSVGVFWLIFFLVGRLFLRLNVITIIISAVIITFLAMLLEVSRSNAKKARNMQTTRQLYGRTQKGLLKIAFCIMSPFYYILICFSCVPIDFGMLFGIVIFPIVLLTLLLSISVSDFCYNFGVKHMFFWGGNVLTLCLCVLIGRIVASVISRY